MSPVAAVLLDAFGTLVSLDPPGPRLRDELWRRAGIEVTEEAATAAFRAEIGYYLEHHMEGRDAESLDGLRDRCAEVVAAALGLEEAPEGAVRAAMLGALSFRPFPDAAPTLAALRDRGLRLVVVSNWDCSLPEVLARTGLGGLVDAVVASAPAGVAKPDPRLYELAVREAGVTAAEALHVGDSREKDLEAARAAGLRAVLVARGEPPAPDTIDSLARLPALLEGGPGA